MKIVVLVANFCVTFVDGIHSCKLTYLVILIMDIMYAVNPFAPSVSKRTDLVGILSTKSMFET